MINVHASRRKKPERPALGAPSLQWPPIVPSTSGTRHQPCNQTKKKEKKKTGTGKGEKTQGQEEEAQRRAYEGRIQISVFKGPIPGTFTCVMSSERTSVPDG
jgi:hypothetical protein